MLKKLVQSHGKRLAAQQKALGMVTPMAMVPTSSQRGYFSLMDRVRDKIQQPLRHFKAYVEPDGIN